MSTNKSRLDLAQIKGQLLNASGNSLSDDFEILNKMFFWDELKVGVTSEISLYGAIDTRPITSGFSYSGWEGYIKKTTYKNGALIYKEIYVEYLNDNQGFEEKEKTILYKDDGSTPLLQKIKTYTYDDDGTGGKVLKSYTIT